MWWYEEGAPERRVRIRWRRVESGPDALETCIEDARWRQKGGSHWFVYQEPAEAAQGSPAGQSALKLEPGALTWMRRGPVTWTHRFVPGRTTYSELHVQGRAIPVAVAVEAMDVRLCPDGGEVRVRCRMGLGRDTDPAEADLIDLVFTLEQLDACAAHASGGPGDVR
ncbi:DUF1934 family protein [Alicyclobacillus shizuokensis]|uniref:DUF1934 family protein n=1 Tax=Alicyclobacillus shizuokensis TaxID=392014 RepID=UPI00082C9F1B|nr:DUF1934 family protein [Alicyclobacillus shizuokensis]MCL6625202.1 DUF1934 family protein [Alicyclobacillus shizuokensis]